MKIGDIEITTEQLIKGLQAEENKADFEALRGTDLFKSTVTQEGVDEWLQSEQGQRYLQPITDRAVTKGIQSHLEKNKDKYVSVDDYNALKQENEGKLTEYETQLKNNTIRARFEKDLLKSGLKVDKIDLAMKLVDFSKISLDGDNLLGARELQEKLQNDVPEFFGKDTVKGGVTDPPRQSQAAGTEPEFDAGLEAFKQAAGLK